MTDPANPRDSRTGITPQRDLIAAGFKAVVAPTNTLARRIEAVTHFLAKRAGFFIADHCGTASRGFDGGYRYPELKSKGSSRTYSTEPVKDLYSTIHDSIQYGCLYLRQGVENAREEAGVLAGWKRNKLKSSTRKLA